MQLPLYAILLLSWLFVTSLSTMAQDEQSVQLYTQQAQRYEKQGEFSKALDTYRKAQANATPADRKAINQSIDRLDDLLQQQTLLNQARTDDIQRRIALLTNLQTRKRLQEDLVSLQQQANATQADYQRLSRRIEAEKDVEDELAATTSGTTPSPRRSDPPRRVPVLKPKPTAPPPKSITVSMPGEVGKGRLEIKTTKSAGPLLKATRKSN